MSVRPDTDIEANVALMTRMLNYAGDAGLTRLAEEADSFIHPDIDWYPGLMTFGKKVYRGREEYLAYLAQAARGTTKGAYINVHEIRPVGEDWVLGLAWVHYENEEGKEFDSEYALLARTQSGLIRDLRSFSSLAEAERVARDA
jgi:ketosteroid isomerase-like protein